jgi:hypothetical protein
LVRFTYVGSKQQVTSQGAPSTAQRPVADQDDEFRITMANTETFIFRASKAVTTAHNPCIEKWEKVIRKFAKNVRVGI